MPHYHRSLVDGIAASRVSGNATDLDWRSAPSTVTGININRSSVTEAAVRAAPTATASALASRQLPR
jgi:hypothetical protein